jgi:hypothetical protein
MPQDSRPTGARRRAGDRQAGRPGTGLVRVVAVGPRIRFCSRPRRPWSPEQDIELAVGAEAQNPAVVVRAHGLVLVALVGAASAQHRSGMAAGGSGCGSNVRLEPSHTKRSTRFARRAGGGTASASAVSLAERRLVRATSSSAGTERIGRGAGRAARPEQVDAGVVRKSRDWARDSQKGPASESRVDPRGRALAPCYHAVRGRAGRGRNSISRPDERNRRVDEREPVVGVTRPSTDRARQSSLGCRAWTARTAPMAGIAGDECGVGPPARSPRRKTPSSPQPDRKVSTRPHGSAPCHSD